MKERTTPKQARFVDEYLKDRNTTQAAIRCGLQREDCGAEPARVVGLCWGRICDRQAHKGSAASALESRRTAFCRSTRGIAFLDPAKLF